MNPLLIQLIGGVGVLFLTLSFQKNKRSFTLMSQLAGSCFFLIHFVLLGGWTGVGMNVIAALRSYIFNLREKKSWAKNDMTMYVFVALFWIAGAVTWQGYLSIFPVYAMTLECFALWADTPKKMRRIYLFARPGWIVYDFMMGSYAGLLSEVTIITSLIVAVFRFDRKKK
ncbi:YgjV family protein [Candidatus Gracilibacteria bacterium]|nr:YgjV family protein [Candidatus Gracilibacteria bacterium]